VVEEALTAAEQNGNDRHVQLVDEAGAQVLLDGGHAAAKPHVQSIGGFEGSFQGRLDSVSDEVERSSLPAW
jgi:hypothetical protein